nr:PP2C family protein-serine/threonine phosphatase [Geodermatophilus tzadiensis]
MGDVAGQDTAAAATMGQLRSLLRGIGTGTGAGPADVLRDLDRSIALLRLSTLVTAAARLEQTPAEIAAGTTRLRWSNAGHPPPVALSPAGAMTVLDDGHHDGLLGVAPGPPRRERVTVLEQSSPVLLYTESVVERRDFTLTGAGPPHPGAARPGRAPAAGAVRHLVERMVDHRPDDVALVAVRLHSQDWLRPDRGAARLGRATHHRPRGDAPVGSPLGAAPADPREAPPHRRGPRRGVARRRRRRHREPLSGAAQADVIKR